MGERIMNYLEDNTRVTKLLAGGEDWLESSIILLTRTGSRAYGTDIETSDYDYRGVLIQPMSHTLGLCTTYISSYRQRRPQDKSELTITPVRAFVDQALKGIPNNIELLFTREEDIIRTDIQGLGDILLSHRNEFITKWMWLNLGGYARAESKRMMEGSTEKIGLYGYNTKAFMHGIRLLNMYKEALVTGTFSTYRPEREELLRCRNGAYTADQAKKIIMDLYNEVNELNGTSTMIPAEPDVRRIETWLIALQCLVYDKERTNRLLKFLDNDEVTNAQVLLAKKGLADNAE